ncbi:putative integrase core domain protein, partial [Operophtera brumata]
MEQGKLKVLLSQREYVFRAIQILYDLSKDMFQDRSKIPTFKSRFSRVQSIREEFVQVTEKIQALQLTIKPDQAIDQIFDALVERYQNKRILAITYLDKILNYPALKLSGNFQELQTLTNVFYESVHALKALNIPNLGDFILFHLVSRILDMDTRKRFESQNSSQVPSFSELLKFLQDYVKVLETSRLSSTNPTPPTSRGTVDGKTPAARSRPISSGSKRSSYLNKTTPSTPFNICSCCGEAHSTYRCPTFQSLDSRARLALVDRKKLCTNCLRTNHVIDKCISKISCLICGLRHHTLLHTDTPQPSGSDVAQASTSVTQASTSVTQAHVGNSRGVVLLGTCQLRVCNAVSGAQHTVRALVDSGAQDCFITTACARTLGLKLQHCNLIVGGLGQNTVFQVRGETHCVLRPLDSNDPHFMIKPIVLDNITAKMPSAELPSVVREHCRHLTLADRDFDVPADIDILIGAELFHDIYDGQRIKLGPGLPTALHSVFGWILTGTLESNVGIPPPNTSSLLAATRTLDEQVKRFWEVEEVPCVPIPIPEDEIAERAPSVEEAIELKTQLIQLLSCAQLELRKWSKLCGAVLLSKVVNRIYSLLSKKLNIDQSYLFTDSSTVLSWLSTEPHKLKTFVAHRVVQVTEATSTFVWKHVPTHDNPADLCSRGLSCAQLAACERWWSGPPWLTSDLSNWPARLADETDDVPELKTTLHSCLIETQEADILHTLLERTSTLTRLQRITAWLYRFINNAKVGSSKRNLTGFLSSSELDESLRVLVKHVQKRDFSDVSSQIKTNKPIPKHLQKLSIFIDSAGVMRVGGRLKQSDLPDSVKHPYLLPKQSRLSELLIDYYHVSYLHSGPRLLHSLIQRRFWILGLRNLIRSRLSRCVTCFKVKPTPFQPVMGDLPPSRLKPGHCFQSIGIDFGGPFM